MAIGGVKSKETRSYQKGKFGAHWTNVSKASPYSPDAYSGDTSWTDWVDHFEVTALVNGWDDAAKLVWLPVRLTGKAQVAWKRLTADARGSYDTAKEALHKRFEPDSKRQLYAAEFHSRRRRRAEQWGDFADALHCLADKAFPTLGEEAKALLALDRYLGELDDTKVAFAVRQGRPKTLEEAVAATLEMESYLSHGQKKEAGVSVVHEQMDGGQEVDTACANREVLPLLDAIVARLERLETDDRGQMVSIDFVVVEMLKVESLMGLDFLERYSCVVDLSEKVLQFKGVQVPLSKQTANRKHCQIGRVNVSLLETVTIPPFSEVETLANTELGEGDGGIWLLEGLEHPNLSVLVAAAVVSPLQEDALCSVPIRMVNPLSTEVVVHKGTKIAKLEKMDEWMLAPIQLTETAAEEIPEVPMHKQDVLHEMAEQCGVEDGLGRTRVVKHSIVTGDNPPIKQSCRRAPPSKREHVRQLIQDMLKKDVIQPSSSPWASPVVIVQKKDGSYRFCVDYRKINTITRKDAYPLPRIDDTIEALSGSQWFSTLDLLWGYWQVEMSEEDRAKTAFSTHEGLYEFKVMPFGLCNAPATFQRLMDLVLSGIQWSSCLVYIDDIVIVGKTVQNHLTICKGDPYLGHRITRDGVATDPGKIDAMPVNLELVLCCHNYMTDRSEWWLTLVGYSAKLKDNTASQEKSYLQCTKESNPYTESTSSEHVSRVPHADSGSGHCRTISIGWVEAYGIPNQEAIHSDQGRQFESNLVQDISSPRVCKESEKSLEDAYSRVREHLGTTVERQKEVYDLKVHGKAFEIGDLVWLHNPVVGRGMAKKLHCPWSGPFRIIKKLSSVVYRIQDTRRARKNRKVVHFDRLKPCSENTRLDDSNLEVRSQTEPGVSDVLPKEQVPGNQLQLMDDDGAESEPENAEPAQRDVAPREQQIETDNLPVPSDPDAGEGHGQPEPSVPDLEEAARERLALNQFLGELDKPQVAFGVRQGRPKSLDEAVSLTIELESYIGGSHGKPARVNFSQVDAELPNASASTTVAEEQECSGVLAFTLQSINERLQRLELRLKNSAAVSLINNCVWNQIARAGHVAELQQWIGNRLVGVNGSPLSTKGFGSFDIVFGNKKFGATLIVTGDITVGAILGLDFLENHKCCIDCGAKILTFPQNKLSVQVHHVMPVKVEAPIECPAIGLVTLEKIVVPPSSEMEVMVKQASPGIGTWMVETDTSCRTGVMVARSLVCTNSSSLVPIRLLNSANNSVVLKKGMKVASMSQLHEDCTTQNISAVTEHIPLSQGDQEALWSMVCKVGDHLNDGEKELLFHLLMEYADVFAFNSGQIGRTNILKHRIDTGNTPPVHLLPRRIPQSRREEMANLVKDMLEQGAIQQSDSPWSSPVVLVKKKDGSENAYPLPRVDDTLDTLAGSRLFTTLDLASGYWQVVAEEDQPKTAFTTPEGLFQFRVMPFGLCNAPATFQRLMDRVLGGLKWSSCLVYLDDIIIVGTSFSEHLRNLAGVLQRLRQAGLKLKPSKYYSRRFVLDTDASDIGIGTKHGDVIEGSVTSLPCTSCTPQWIRQQQLDDCSIRPVYQALESKLMLSADEVKPWSRESRLLWQQHTSLYLKDGVLWRRVLGGGEGKLQLVVPAKLRQDILRSLHEGALSAHLGEEKMRNLLKERFYWPSCADDVSEWCSCCAVCCSRKTHAPKRRAGLQTLQVGYPLQMVCVDLLGPLPETETGSRYVLVAVDHFTKWAEAYGIPNQEAATVARKLVDEMFCRFSPPEQLHSDQGRQFESELVKEVCKLLEIKKTHTTPYHPQCNGIVERFNRTLLGMLATTVDSYPSSWEQNIRRVCLAYNSSVH
eukprot:Em0075g1a